MRSWARGAGGRETRFFVDFFNRLNMLMVSSLFDRWTESDLLAAAARRTPRRAATASQLRAGDTVNAGVPDPAGRQRGKTGPRTRHPGRTELAAGGPRPWFLPR